MCKVLTTLFISVSTALPKTAYIKVGKKKHGSQHPQAKLKIMKKGQSNTY